MFAVSIEFFCLIIICTEIFVISANLVKKEAHYMKRYFDRNLHDFGQNAVFGQKAEI
ncbi:hypothetical protein [Acinetobacter phage vB_AbaS_TCUP2199]|nr:hypothetical protein [Acinetobacter phage vB_AbaS_TCUP2199]